MFHSSKRTRCFAFGVAAIVLLVASTPASGSTLARALAAPSPRDFMRVLDAQIQGAKPREVFRRTVVFNDVRAGAPEGTVFPFTATVSIHDYNPGFPPAHYYGKTCITRIGNTRYDMHRDRIGEWVVDTRTIPEPVCTQNPVEGKSAFPLDSLRGTRVGTSNAPPELMPKKKVNVNLRLGEYACTRPGGRIASQMGFRLNRDKTYTDVDGARGGTYTFELFAGTLMFQGGFLDKVGGKSVNNESVFSLSGDLTCAPW